MSPPKPSILRRIWRRLRSARRSDPRDPRALLQSWSLEEIYDHLVLRLGFDTSQPSWSEALRRLHRHSRQRRLQVIPEFFYTSVLFPESLPPSVWEGSFPDCGTFDLDAQRAFLRDMPPGIRDELERFPATGEPGGSQYYWLNEQFSHSDASFYYSMIRRFRPNRIVEVGAGYSTKLAMTAVEANGTGRILCIDPYAPPSLKLRSNLEIRAQQVQDVPVSVFEELGASDILFIDGSHISKTGSDVNHLFLRVLPKLPKGVLVHIHDVCLPFEYPKNWATDYECYWNEQYVVAALLANSSKYEVVLGTYFLQKTDESALAPFVPRIPGVMPGGGSLWLRTL